MHHLYRLGFILLACCTMVTCGTESEKKDVLKIKYSFSVDSMLKSKTSVSPVVDSLKKEILKVSTSKAAIDIINEMAGEFHEPPRNILVLANEALRLSQACNYSMGEASAYSKIGFYHYWISQFDTAISYFQKAMRTAREGELEELQCKVHINMGQTLTFLNEADSAMHEYERAFKLAEKINNCEQQMSAICFMGELKLFQGYLEEAKLLLEKGLKFARAEKNLSKESFCLVKLGDLERLRNNYPAALRLLNETIIVSRKNKDNSRIAFSLSSMGDIYSMKGDTTKAISYFNKSIEYSIRAGDNYLLSGNYARLGQLFSESGKLDKSEFYFNRALLIDSLIANEGTAQFCKNGLAEVYRKTNRIDSAMVLLKEVEDFATKIADLNLMSSTLRAQTEIYISKQEWNLALQTALRAYDAAEKSKIPYNIQTTSKNLYNLYLKEKNYAKALRYFERHIAQRDSMSNSDQVRKFASVEYTIKEEKLKAKQARREAMLNAEKAVKDKEIENQRNVNIALILGAGLVVLLLIVALRANRIKKKANDLVKRQKGEVELQKSIIEQKQKEILDSINYAQGLQQAILARPEEIIKHVPEMFLFYKPKDIVAGDFYFFEVTDTHLFIAAADCTGHGVPGAMVSIVCSNALTRCVKEFGLHDPGKILDKTSDLVSETFEKSGTNVQDGMDISLMAINRKTKDLVWAGAHNHLVYFQNCAMTEIHATKRPVGKSENKLSFKSHHITYVHPTSFYLYTDGFSDQFGGSSGRKLKRNTLLKLISENTTLSMSDQKVYLMNYFENWKGNLEQVDDVCVFGVRV